MLVILLAEVTNVSVLAVVVPLPNIIVVLIAQPTECVTRRRPRLVQICRVNMLRNASDMSVTVMLISVITKRLWLTIECNAG